MNDIVKNNLNVFENPEYYRKILLEQKNLIKYNNKNFDGKSLICVFFTSYCGVGCPFCFFHSPTLKENNNLFKDIENRFSERGIEKFIKFANDANVGYLQISGGGEPFLEKDAILKCIEKVNAQRIILVTSGFWAFNEKQAEKYLAEIYEILKNKRQKTRLTIRVSISKYHSIKLKEKPLVNLLKIFEKKYNQDANFTLQLKIFEEDNILFEYLDKYFPGYQFSLFGDNLSDDKEIIKIMPWKYRLTLKSGYNVIVGKSRIFNSNLRPNLYSNEIKISEKIYDTDLELSQKDFPSVVFNSDGKKGFDWIVEYNGNVCTWQNRVQDNLLNIYEDDYNTVVNSTVNDLITYSYIDKGAKYRNRIVSEVSPRTVSLMKAVNIRDYAGTLLFEDEKIRLYYNIRVIQDYICENKINIDELNQLPIELVKTIKLNKSNLINKYKSSNYSILSQEIAKNEGATEFYDFLELVKLGHFELSKEQIKIAIQYYNSIVKKDFIKDLNDINISNGMDVERRLTKRVMNIKKLKVFGEGIKFYLCRHGETNWNVENKIKGQLEDAPISFTKNGLLQIEDLLAYLKEQKIEAIFTSDLLRTQETSKIINRELGLPIYYCKELRGLNMGIYQGKNMSEFLKDSEVQKAFKNHNIPLPGGESINQLNERFMSVLNNIIKKYSYTKVAIISHGAAISNIKSYISKDDYKDIDKCVIKYDGYKFNVLESDIYAQH